MPTSEQVNAFCRAYHEQGFEFPDPTRVRAALEVVEALEPAEWEYRPGRIREDGDVFVQSGTIAPSFVPTYLAERGDVIRRRVGEVETVTAETTDARFDAPDSPTAHEWDTDRD